MADELAQLTELLSEDYKCIESLQTLLAEEKEILIKREFDKLNELSENKQTLIEAIQSNNEKKITILSPFSNEKEPVKLLEALVNKFGEAKTRKLKEMNQQLEEKLEKCRRQNAANGQVIIRSLKDNKELINIVTGKTTGNELYNSLGKSTSSTTTNPYHQKV